MAYIIWVVFPPILLALLLFLTRTRTLPPATPISMPFFVRDSSNDDRRPLTTHFQSSLTE